MKRIIALALVLVMVLSLCACGKSEEVKAAEAAITAIGEVTLQSGKAIEEAEALAEALTAEDKEKVENLETLSQARADYDALVEEVANGILDQINELTGCIESLNIARCMELMDQIEADIAALPADVQALIIDATATNEGETLLELFPSFRETLTQVAVHDTYIARPEYVVSVPTKGGWLVNDRADFAAYNCWIESETDLAAAYEEYKDYVGSLTEIDDNGLTFTFLDNSGNTVTVLMQTSGVLQVRTLPFEE